VRRGAFLSSILHAVVVAAIYFGVPSLFSPDASIEEPIPVTLYTVADETNLPTAAPEPKPEPKPDPKHEGTPAPVELPPQPAVEVANIPPPPAEPLPEPVRVPEPVVEAPPPTPAPEPEPAVEVVPPPPTPEKAEAPKPPPPPAPKPKPKPKKIAKAKPKPKVAPPPAKPAPKPKPKLKAKPAEKPAPQQFSSLLKNLAAKQRAQDKKAEDVIKKAAAQTPAPAPVSRGARDEPLSLSVIDAIRRQVEDKWSVPVGARDAGDIGVEIRIFLDPDGTVKKAEIVDQARLGRAGEEVFRAIAESAVRAVRRASPLRSLPPEKYEQWREITFLFRPPA